MYCKMIELSVQFHIGEGKKRKEEKGKGKEENQWGEKRKRENGLCIIQKSK